MIPATDIDRPAVYDVLQHATYRVFEDLVFIALVTDNPEVAKARYRQAKEMLDERGLGDLREMAQEEFGFVLG